MLCRGCLLVLAACCLVSQAYQPEPPDATRTESTARDFMERLNVQLANYSNQAALAEWGYASNITDENLQIKLRVGADLAKFMKYAWNETGKYPWTTFSDPEIRRQFMKLSVIGAAALDADKYEKLEEIISDMQKIYSTAQICDYRNSTKCDLSLEPELTQIMANSRDPDVLKHVWVQFHKNAGDKIRHLFPEYISLTNEGAVLNNFTDASEEWVRDYESPDFQQQISDLWVQMRPLYEQLHAYVRRRLRLKYGEQVVSRTGPIPAHLLGNMWAQNWGNILDICQPYPGKEAVDVTDVMKKKGYTPVKMFEMAEEFFKSVNLSAMPETFWNRSILEKPEGRDLICHASAWDFYDQEDFRIKQCTRVSMEQLLVAHHEMGHVQYFLHYKDRPMIYREGANPGFHEAVGDTIALSVSTPKHLRKVGLLPLDVQDDPERDMNHLGNMGLEKIAFLPFAYVMDQWRWNVFKGKITKDNYNCEWWKLRYEYQGIEPPVDRSEDNFDPGSKYHIIASVPYIRYFVSFVIQFQFHRALCEKAGQFDPADPDRLPLHQCDIYQSTDAGNLFGKMLEMGSSKPWPEAMEVVTGQRKMDASALMQYFRPLQKWLEEENKKTGETIGWIAASKGCRNSAAKSPPQDTPGA